MNVLLNSRFFDFIRSRSVNICTACVLFLFFPAVMYWPCILSQSVYIGAFGLRCGTLGFSFSLLLLAESVQEFFYPRYYLSYDGWWLICMYLLTAIIVSSSISGWIVKFFKNRNRETVLYWLLLILTSLATGVLYLSYLLLKIL